MMRRESDSGAPKRQLETAGAKGIKHRCIFLLEARAKELMAVARREPKRKRLARSTSEAHRVKARTVTAFRPEADVIYTLAGRSRPDGWWRPATGASISARVTGV